MQLPLLDTDHKDGCSLPDKQALLKRFSGIQLDQLQTPFLAVDETIFKRNCQKMKSAVDRLGWDFRAHIKTHKASEGVALQCSSTGPRIVCSTLPEIWHVINKGLVEDGLVKDILYSMPLPIRLIQELADIAETLHKHKAKLRLMIDNEAQIEALHKFSVNHNSQHRWSLYLKIDMGTKRAGLPPTSKAMENLIRCAFKRKDTVSIFGTYTHAGFSYASKDARQATQYLADEVKAASDCAALVYGLAKETASKVGEDDSGTLRIACGATPTAHASQEQWQEYQKSLGLLETHVPAIMELHAGNYCLLDAQQVATGLVQESDCALTISATIISTYPEREEALCDAGAIAMSKDVGPLPGRTSQEHGILTYAHGSPEVYPTIGQRIVILPQHACLTAAQHSWFFVVDNVYNDASKVKDVWIPAKGW